MKVSIKKINQEIDEQIVIHCWRVTEKIHSIVRMVQSEDDVVMGYENEKIYQVRLQDIFFIEAVDNKVFAYTKKSVYELKSKLYEIEEAYRDSKFFRCSKSLIINLLKIDHVRPMLNGRLLATLFSGEEVIISRQYVPALKNYLAGAKNWAK